MQEYLDYFDCLQKSERSLIWLVTQALADFLGRRFAEGNGQADEAGTAPAGAQAVAAGSAALLPGTPQKARRPWHQAAEPGVYTAGPEGTKPQHVCLLPSDLLQHKACARWLAKVQMDTLYQLLTCYILSD